METTMFSSSFIPKVLWLKRPNKYLFKKCRSELLWSWNSYRGFSEYVHNFWQEIKDVFLGVVVFFSVPNSILALFFLSDYKEEK